MHIHKHWYMLYRQGHTFTFHIGMHIVFAVCLLFLPLFLITQTASHPHSYTMNKQTHKMALWLWWPVVNEVPLQSEHVCVLWCCSVIKQQVWGRTNWEDQRAGCNIPISASTCLSYNSSVCTDTYHITLISQYQGLLRLITTLGICHLIILSGEELVLLNWIFANWKTIALHYSTHYLV